MSLSSFAITDQSNRIIRNTFTASMLAYTVASLTTSIVSLIDGVVIGQFLGVDSMAAFGLVSPILIVFALIGAVLASGARNRFTILIGLRMAIGSAKDVQYNHHAEAEQPGASRVNTAWKEAAQPT